MGRRPTTTFEARGLPDGLGIHAQTGVIHGTPTSAGKSEGCCVKVFNHLGFFEETLDIHTIEPEACSNLTYKLSMPEDGVLWKDDPVQITPSFDIGFPDGFTCFSVKPSLLVPGVSRRSFPPVPWGNECLVLLFTSCFSVLFLSRLAVSLCYGCIPSSVVSFFVGDRCLPSLFPFCNFGKEFLVLLSTSSVSVLSLSVLRYGDVSL